MSSPHFFAGIDNLVFDKRNFDISNNDIERICCFFSLGKIKHAIKEKGIVVSHSNFFIFIETSHGRYALKFYPKDAAKTIVVEYAINRLLTEHRFSTPPMHAGHGGQPFFLSNGRLATCFSYVDGQQAWQHIAKPNTIHRINAAILSLKKIVSAVQDRILFPKQESFLTTVNTLTRTSRVLAPYERQEMIQETLKYACRTYQNCQSLFIRQPLHNNTTLTNFLIDKETVCTLDLSHIKEDYALSDLASMVISCRFLEISVIAIKMIIKDYFIRHKMKAEHSLILGTLVRIGLIKEYLKNVTRGKSIDLTAYSPDLAETYMSHLSARKNLVADALRKSNDTLTFVV